MENQVPEIAGGRDATDWRNNACEVAARSKTVISVLPARALPSRDEWVMVWGHLAAYRLEVDADVNASPVRGGFRITHADIGDTVMVATAAEAKACLDGARFAVDAIWGGAEVVLARGETNPGEQIRPMVWQVVEADPEGAPSGGDSFAAFESRNEALAFAAGMPYGA